MSEIIMSDDKNTFIEEKCCIKHESKNYCFGGSYLCVRTDTGKMVGIMYASDKESVVTSWDGTIKIPAIYGKEYRNNFGALCQSVWFRYQDHYFYGRWLGKERSQIVRCKEITEKSYFGYELSKRKYKGMI